MNIRFRSQLLLLCHCLVHRPRRVIVLDSEFLAEYKGMRSIPFEISSYRLDATLISTCFLNWILEIPEAFLAFVEKEVPKLCPREARRVKRRVDMSSRRRQTMSWLSKRFQRENSANATSKSPAQIRQSLVDAGFQPEEDSVVAWRGTTNPKMLQSSMREDKMCYKVVVVE